MLPPVAQQINYPDAYKALCHALRHLCRSLGRVQFAGVSIVIMAMIDSSYLEPHADRSAAAAYLGTFSILS